MQACHVLNRTFSELHWTHLGLVDDQTHDCGHQFGAAHWTLPVPVRFLQTRQRVRVPQRRHDVINPADSLGFSGGSSLSRPGENKCGQSPGVRLFSLFRECPSHPETARCVHELSENSTDKCCLSSVPAIISPHSSISRYLQGIWNPPPPHPGTLSNTHGTSWSFVQEHCGLECLVAVHFKSWLQRPVKREPKQLETFVV